MGGAIETQSRETQGLQGSSGPNPGDQHTSTLTPRTATVPNSHVDGIAMTDTNATPLFTKTPAISIAGVFGASSFAYIGLVKLLPKTASRTDGITFVWLVSDLNLKPTDVCTLSLRMEPLVGYYLGRSARSSTSHTEGRGCTSLHSAGT